MTNDASMSIRSARFAGKSVRDTSQAIGAATATQRVATAAEVHRVVNSGLRNDESVKIWR